MKKKMIAIGMAAAMSVTAVGIMAGCGGDSSLTVSGSSSVSPLMEVLADAYEAKNPDVKITVQTSDSGTGVKDAQNGLNDFGMASRALKTSETGVVSKQIATDGVALIVNTAVTDVSDVTSAQVYALYKDGTAIGSLTNAVSRENGSGTRDAFDSLIKDAEGNELGKLTAFSTVVATQNATGAVIEAVKSNANLLGYISLGSVDSSVKTLKFEGVEATAENVKAGTYKLSRPFNIVYQSEDGLSETAKAFIAFIMGEEGQKIVEDEGYVSVV